MLIVQEVLLFFFQFIPDASKQRDFPLPFSLLLEKVLCLELTDQPDKYFLMDFFQQAEYVNLVA